MYTKSQKECIHLKKLKIGYPLFYRVRKLSRSGYLKLDRSSIYISTALAGETIGITDLDESFFSIYFDYIELVLIDRETYGFKPFNQKILPPQKVGCDASSEP